jgi:alcohol dehydrogenase
MANNNYDASLTAQHISTNLASYEAARSGFFVFLVDDLDGIVNPTYSGNPEEAQKAADGVYNWLKSVDVSEKLTDIGFSEADVEKLTDLAFTTPSLDGLINIGPSGNSREIVREIYKNSL